MSEAAETLRLGPRETVTVRVASAELLEVEATYEPGGKPPPRHFHPAQDEHFAVLAGTLHARVGDEERRLQAGDVLDVPRCAVHQMWNCGEELARVRWQTRPGGRTLDWFREIASLNDRPGRGTGPVQMAPLLREYRDVFRLAGPGALLDGTFAVLSAVGRLRR